MLVRHGVRHSAIEGLGVFADEPIAKGQIIWRRSPHVELQYTEAQWREMERDLAPACFEHIRKYAYKRLGIYYLCIDNSQFMNHSIAGSNTVSDNDDHLTIAARDIAAGEEILCNYYEFCDADDYNIQLIDQLTARS